MNRPFVTDWSAYPNFTEAEMRCKHTGLCDMDPVFMAILQQVRTQYGRPMVISSGYRHSTHPVEARKPAPGEHTLGRAVDVAVRGAEAVQLLHVALALGITRIGVQQKGEGRFLHLGMGGAGLAGPMIWSY